MIKRPDTNAQRIKRHKRVRAKISGTPERPRLNVFRSEKNIYAQIIDDVAGNTLVAASSLDKEIEGNGGNKAAARAVGKLVAERAKAKGIEFSLGYSHTITVNPPEGITFELPHANEVVVKGTDKQVVGQVAANIRKLRAPEPYKGKGIKYSDERILRKAGKAGK